MKNNFQICFYLKRCCKLNIWSWIWSLLFNIKAVITNFFIIYEKYILKAWFLESLHKIQQIPKEIEIISSHIHIFKSKLIDLAKCGYFRIYLFLRFYVKSKLPNPPNLHRVSKSVIWHWDTLNLISVNFSPFWRLNWQLVVSPQLISHKIWVIEKSWNFHTRKD